MRSIQRSPEPRVAKILDGYRLVLSRGERDGVHVGQIFCIGGDRITDPETGEYLGWYSGFRVKIVESYPAFSIAETYQLVRRGDPQVSVVVNIGDRATPVSDVAARLMAPLTDGVNVDPCPG